jgi:5-methylthioadenosine/S-adenosylhomocysteine deaminase
MTPTRYLPVLVLLASWAGAAPPQPADLAIAHGMVVTSLAAGGYHVIQDGAVVSKDHRIVFVGQAGDAAKGWTAAQTIDAQGGIVMPGLVNTHGHAAMVLFRGIADDMKLMEWLQKYIFPAEAKNVTADMVKAGTRLAALEMIRSGTTTFTDMYYFENQVAEAAEEAGLRAVAGETVIEFPAPDNKTVADALAYSEGFLKRWKGHPLVTAALAPHSTYLCKPETLTAVKTLADRYGAPILIHVSETQDEQRQIHEKYGKTPTEQLQSLGLLRKGLVAAHGVWLSASDRALLKTANAGVSHCPQSNMKLASGAAAVPAMMAEGMRLGLGTDGAASNNDLDMFEEMDTAALLAKHASGDPTAASARSVFEMATLGGARALGMEEDIGSLEVGKRADVLVVSTAAARLHPLYDVVSQLVYAAKGADVRDVVVDGRVLMRDRKLLTLDEPAVIAEADRLRAQIQASVAQ